MKKDIRMFCMTLICVGAFVLAAGCVSSGGSGQPGLDGTAWRLSAFGSGSAAVAPAGIISLNFGNDSMSGSGGVNSYGGAFTLDAATGNVTFGQVVSTLMAGPEALMADESRYFAALQNVTGYTYAADRLVLRDAAGQTVLTFVPPLANTSWTLVTYTPQASQVPTESIAQVTLLFDGQGKLSGNGGINQYTSSWMSNGTHLMIEPVASTKMAGTPGVMAQEDAYFALLPAADSFFFSMGRLQMTDARGNTILVFQPQLTETSWVLTEMNGTVPLSTVRPVTLVFGMDGTLHGEGPVNLYSGLWRAEGVSGLSVQNIATTLMLGADDGINAFESRYFAILQNASSYRMDATGLVITASDGTTLTYVVNVADLLRGTTWSLAGNANVTLTIQSDGSVSGQAPVNTYLGTAAFSANNGLVLSGIVSTKMSGTPEQMREETAYLASLRAVTGYNLVDGQLVLTGSGGTALLTFNSA